MIDDLSLNIHQLIALRQELHQHPEVSNHEEKTAQRITGFLRSTYPDHLVENIGGHGVAAVYNGKNRGVSVMLRCELDALPIREVNEIEYRSENDGVGHKCGHDGHMAILCGIASLLAQKRPETGRVTLLFQPAEETGEGAARVLADEKFSTIEPDFIYALHNLPGFKKNQIILKDNIFASASRGMIINLKGAPSHASHPEDGKNPALAVSQIIQHLFEIPQMHTELHRASLITPVAIRVGNPAFGTSAGDGEVMATLRAHEEGDMKRMAEKAEKVAYKTAELHELEAKISWTENFEAVNNDRECTEIISINANKEQLNTLKVKHSFPWSEDFGLFTSYYKGALFGLGAGMKQPQLHNNDYDFPDEIIRTGIRIFWNIIFHHLKK